MMRRPGWILAAFCLVLAQGLPARAQTLEALVEPGHVAVRAQEVPLVRILEALSERASINVVLDERLAAQPVTVRLEAGGVPEAIERLMREAGGGNYAIFSSDSRGTVETFAFQGGGGAPAGAPATSPVPPASPGPPAHAVQDGSAAYPPAPREPYERPAASSAPYPSMLSWSPGSGGAALNAQDADDDDDPASPNARNELAALEYRERLETTRRNLEQATKKIGDED